MEYVLVALVAMSGPHLRIDTVGPFATLELCRVAEKAVQGMDYRHKGSSALGTPHITITTDCVRSK